MIKWYGILGLLLIAFGEINIFILKLEPFYSWNYNFFWFGFILVVDSLVYRLKKNSFLMNRRMDLSIAFLSSTIFWWVLEGLNYFVNNWYYINIPEPQVLSFSLAFSTVIPGILEIEELLRALKIFDRFKMQIKNNKLPTIFFISGILSLALPIIYPKYFYGLIWITLFFLLDPINYKKGLPSIITEIKKGSSKPLYLAFAALTAGFFWEFWNFWSHAKWIYTIPFISGNMPQIFEMPLLGYIGYLPFGLEVFVFYNFFKLIFRK